MPLTLVDDEGKTAPNTGDDDALIAECKEFMKASSSAEDENRRNGLAALAFLAGDQWDPAARQSRGTTRPCLTINKLPTFIHQVTNDQLQNQQGIKVHPVDDEADIKTADVLQGLIRHIEYSSNADVAENTALKSATEIGFGYFRLVTQYCDEASFDQEIAFKRIRNSFTVYFDPASTEPDGSDQTKNAISTKMPRSEFKRLYPDAKASNDAILSAIGDNANWVDQDSVRVTEYYRIEHETATLIQLSNGETGWEDEFVADEAAKAGITIAVGRDGRPMRRKSARRFVRWYKLSAVDVLERADIPCRWIPVFKVTGDEIDIDGKVLLSGLVKNAMDPARLYNMWMTCATEEVALRPKAKYIMAEGQEEGHESEWANANNSASPYITYKPKALGGTLAPPPQRQPLADIPSGMLAMAMHAADDIKATTGLFDSSLGARGSATSGIQERAQQRQGDVANLHYAYSARLARRQAGRCIIDMVPKVYDAERVVRLMGEDGAVSHANINQPIPAAEQKPDPKTKAIKTILNDLTVGRYDVTVSSGPSYDTLRQETLESMVDVAGKWPKLMDIAGDKVVKAMDWHGADEIADRIKRSMPPEIVGQEDEDKDSAMVNTPNGPIPLEQAGQLIGQMHAQLQQADQALQEASSGITAKQIDAQSRDAAAQISAASAKAVAEIRAASAERIAQTNAISAGDVAELRGLIELLKVKLQPPPELAAEVGKDITKDQP